MNNVANPLNYVTEDVLAQVCQETEQMLNDHVELMNKQATMIELLRFILLRFVPEPLLKQAVSDFWETKTKEINDAVEKARLEALANATPPSQAN